MKRFCLVTLALLLLLATCSGVSPSPSAEIESPSPSVAVSPEVSVAPSVDPSPEVSPSPEPSPDPEALIRERFEQLEAEGKTLLTEEELLWFETEFFNMDDHRIRNAFLIGEYESSEKIDPFNVFSEIGDRIDEELNISDNELALLYDAFIAAGVNGETVYIFTPIRTTSDYADAILLKYTGLTLKETEKGSFGTYLEAYDAYYTFRSDTELFSVKVESGRWNEDGSVALLYKGWAGYFFVATLTPHDDSFWFVSNLRLDESGNTLPPMTFNEVINSLANK